MPPTARRSLLVVALLAVVALGLAGIAPVEGQTDGSAGTVIAQENTTGYLNPPAENVTQEAYATVGVDVASAVSVDATRLAAEHERRTFENDFEDSAGDPDAQLSLASEHFDSLLDRTDVLDRKQERLYRAFAAGELDERELIRNIALLEVQAEQQLQYRDTIRETVDRTPGTALPVDKDLAFRNMDGETVLLDGPVEQGLVDSLTGTATERTVYLQGADDALVLATIDRGTYLRQATIRAHRLPGAPDQFGNEDQPSISAAFEHASERYPWFFENAIGNPSIRGFGNTSVYHIDGDHSQGSLATYIDGATREPFHEYQLKNLDDVPLTGTVTESTAAADLTVEMTHPTGPMRLTTTDSGGGPVNAAVQVEGTAVGTTGTDGQLWTVQPLGEFDVTVTTADNETVSVTASGTPS